MPIDLSICIAHKNRSCVNIGGGFRYLLPNCIRALANTMLPDDLIEIVVADWHSTDWYLRDWIYHMAVPATVKIVERWKSRSARDAEPTPPSRRPHARISSSSTPTW